MSLPEVAPESIALVTGASSGIGEQFARQLAEHGYRVALVARRENRLEQLAQELGGSDRAIAIGADLTKAADRDRLASRIAELDAEVEILVNNAGYGIYRPFGEAGSEAEVDQVRLLLEAPVDLMARFLPAMVKRRRGAVINMSSTAGLQPGRPVPDLLDCLPASAAGKTPARRITMASGRKGLTRGFVAAALLAVALAPAASASPFDPSGALKLVHPAHAQMNTNQSSN